MPAQWFSWSKTLACTTDKDQVYDVARSYSCTPKEQPPYPLSHSKACKLNCSWSLSNLKDVVHGNTRVIHKSSSCSPQSVDSISKFGEVSVSSDPVVQLADPRYELSMRALNGLRYTLRPGTPRPPTPIYASSRGTPIRNSINGCNVSGDHVLDHEQSKARASSDPATALINELISRKSCTTCGQSFSRNEHLNHHAVVLHAVTELRHGDSSRNIVEIIFRTSWLKKEIGVQRIERILKIHNTQRTLSKFEEYREAVKLKASGMAMGKKHARCIADGNELLRFYGSWVDCPLGANGSSSLCTISTCKICHIIRSGFSTSTSLTPSSAGIHTSATSGNAHDRSMREGKPSSLNRHSMLVCRVIAGRMHKGSAARLDGLELPEGFNSVVGEVGPYSNLEDLYVFNPRAMLPCFAVIYH